MHGKSGEGVASPRPAVACLLSLSAGLYLRCDGDLRRIRQEQHPQRSGRDAGRMLCHDAGNLPIDDEVTFEITEWPKMDKPQSTYATLRQDIDDQGNVIPNKYVLHANAKNNLGKIILTAQYKGTTYTKTVEIVPLW